MMVPKAYLAQDDSTSRAVLSSEDVRFARSVLRVQKGLVQGFDQTASVHLAALNIDPSSVPWQTKLQISSSIYELAQVEVLNAKADLASRMKEFVSTQWVLNHVFGMADSDIEDIRKQRRSDVEEEAVSTAKAEASAAKEAPPEESRGAYIDRMFTDDALVEGDSMTERRSEEKFAELMDSDDDLRYRMTEIKKMLKDIKGLTGAPTNR